MSYRYEDLFMDSSIHKDLIIEFENGEIITNDKIYAESFVLTESICSNNELTFGNVEANSVKFTLSDTLKSHKNLWFDVYFILDNREKTKYKIGKYYVVEDKAQANKTRRDITAYDMLYQIVNTDVSAWYNEQEYPMTLKSFRTSFNAFCGVEEIDVELINDAMMVEKTIIPSLLSGADVLSSICELNGCFPNINREDKMEYIFLPIKGSTNVIYPSNTLYPNDDLFPHEASNHTRITRNVYQACDYDEYITEYITKLQIRESENDIGAISGTGDNCYIIENNFLVYGKSAEELKTIADNLFSVLSMVEHYRPFTCTCIGNPCRNLGQSININTKYEVIESFILKRELKGIQSIKDYYSATGVENYAEVVNDVNTNIVQLKSKTNILERTVERTLSQLTDFEKDVRTEFEQTAESINLKVTKGDVSSQISQEAEQISITGNRFVLSSTNCSIGEDGTITATNVDLNGRIKTSNADNLYVHIEDGKVEFGRNDKESGHIQTFITQNDAIGIGIASDFVRIDAGILNLPVGTYVGTSLIATQGDLTTLSNSISQTYLTKSDASLTYAEKSALNSYITETTAKATYLSIGDASATYLDKLTASTTYLDKLTASTNYAPKFSGATGTIMYLKDANGMTGSISVSNGVITFMM